jgi:hypothetical protein
MQHYHIESDAQGCRQDMDHHAQRIPDQHHVDERIEERCHGRAVRGQADFPLQARICGTVSRGDLGGDTPIPIPSVHRADRLRCTPCPHK